MYQRIFDKDISLHSGVPRIYSHLKNKQFNEWEIPPWELFIDSSKLLGEGSWAKVYLAEWRHTTVVAKVLKNTFDEHAKYLIIKELENMTKMHHPNIVQLFGYVEEPFVIVMEYFQNGDLYENLNKLKLSQKIKISKDILKGLIYIHERRPNGLIHRDIKLRNILLTNSYTAKIADFGLSTFSISKIMKIASNNNLTNYQGNASNASNSQINLEINDNSFHGKYLKSVQFDSELTDNVGTERYMAPEIKTKFYDNKVDIYSTGILLYELFTNNIYDYNLNWNYFNKLPKQFKEIIIDMTRQNSKDRPTASYVLQSFNRIKFETSLFKRISSGGYSLGKSQK